MGINIGKNISKSFSGKYSPRMLAMHQKLLDQAKKLATDALKTSSKRVIQKIAEVTGDLIGNKIADKITKVSKNLHYEKLVCLRKRTFRKNHQLKAFLIQLR